MNKKQRNALVGVIVSLSGMCLFNLVAVIFMVSGNYFQMILPLIVAFLLSNLCGAYAEDFIEGKNE